MMSILVAAGIGGLLGAGLGYLGQCSSGTCPLTATWWRGAMYGAALGAVAGFGSGNSSILSSGSTSSKSTNVIHVTQADFDAQVLRSAQPVLVDFYAPWCGPCRTLEPVVAKLADEFAGRVKVTKINVDNAPELADRFRVSGIPALHFFKDGKAVDSVVGLVSEKELRSRLDKLSSTSHAQAGQSRSAESGVQKHE